MLENFWDKARSLAAFRARIVELSGQVAGSEHAIAVRYIGNGTNLSFVSRTIFGGHATEREIGRCNIWRAGSWASAAGSEVDIVVVDVPWPYDIAMPHDQYVIEIPAWLRQQAQLADTWKGVIAGLRKSVRDSQLRKIRKFKLSFATTNDPLEVDRFYGTMYVPHTLRRFGESASVESREDVQRCVAGGTLLSVIRDGETISACVLLDKEDVLQLLFIGFSARDLREIDGASAGLYYFTLSYAFENGFRYVDFSGSRPFLNDGVLAVKRRWGAGVFDDWSLENLLIQPNRFSPGVEAFLSSHPLITCHGDELIGKVLVRDGPVTAELVRKLSRQYISPGIDGLNIYGLQGIRDDASDALPSDSARVRLVDLRDSGDRVAGFCE